MTPPTHPLQEGSFDALAMLRRTRGDGSDVRSIKLRMLWLRQRVPEARVTTSLVTLDANVVVMAAAIALPDGGEGAGHAASRITEDDDLAALIETTELRAIGRALDILGYVVVDQPGPQPAPDRPEPTTSTDREPTPIARERGERCEPSPREETARPEPSQQEPQGQGIPPGHVQALRTLRERGGRETPHRPEPSQAPEAQGPRPVRRQAPPAKPSSDAEPELEDVSWTAFWNWARTTYQLSSRVQLEELLGQSIGQKTPGQVRQLLSEHCAGSDTPESD